MGAALLLFNLLALPEPWPNPPEGLLEVYFHCREHPTASSDWFPRGRLKMPLPKLRPGEDESVDRLASTRCFAGSILRSYREPVLAQGFADEIYRVIWQPSFAPPVVIRLFRSKDGILSAMVKRDLAEGEQLSGQFTESNRAVAAVDFEKVHSAAEQAGCWSPGNTCNAQLSDPTYLSGGQMVLFADGESWLLEGSHMGEHWAVQVDHPRGGPFMEVCAAIVKAAQAEQDLTIGGRAREWKSPTQTSDGGN